MQRDDQHDQADELLSPTEAAELLGITPRAVKRLVRLGRLPGYRPTPRVTRVRRSAVVAYLEAVKVA